MKRRRFQNWSGLVLALGVLTGAALAQAPSGPGPQGSPPGPGAEAIVTAPGQPAGDALRAIRLIATYLDFSEAQSEQVREVLRASAEAVRDIEAAIRPLEAALREELAGDDPSPDSVGYLVIEIHDLRGSVAEARRDALEAVRGLLTPEQLGKVEAVREAARLEPVVHAFKILNLLPPPHPPETGE